MSRDMFRKANETNISLNYQMNTIFACMSCFPVGARDDVRQQFQTTRSHFILDIEGSLHFTFSTSIPENKVSNFRQFSIVYTRAIFS